jgi:nucleotide-binding universal stress UspA family protein
MLVAVSSPWASERLARPITGLAQRLGAEAVIAHVATLQDEDEQESDATQRGEQTLKVLSESLQEAGVTTEGIMLFSDDTPKALMNTAHARGCTFIVLGLTSRGMLRRLIAGDVPGNIIRQADLPVLLCPSSWSGNF